MKIYNTRIDLVKDLVNTSSICVELGVLYGSYAQHIFNQNPKQLYLVDLWNSSMPCGDDDGNDLKWYDPEYCLFEIKRKFENKENVIVTQKDSVSFLKQCEDNFFDFIYIDTTHTYHDTLIELELSYLKCKPGGYICGHDFDLNTDRCKSYYEFYVDKAVYEFCYKYNQKIFGIAMDGCSSFVIKKSVN